MLGGSPTKVAVPSRLDITASPTINIVGFIFNFLHRLNAIGAITRTVATFSTNMEIMPVIARISTMATPVEGEIFTSQSAIFAGTFE